MSGRGRSDYAIDLDEGLDKYDDAEDRALSRIRELGLSGPEKPPLNVGGDRFNGRIPSNLSGESPQIIGEYYNLMEAYTNYVSWQRQLAEVAMLSAKEKLTLSEAAVRKTKTGSVQEKRDSAVVDTRYVAANASWVEARCEFLLLKNIEEGGRRDMGFISRIIETKKLQWEQGRRGANLDQSSGASRFNVGRGRSSRRRRTKP